MRSLQEVLLEREMKTVKTVKAPDAAGRHTTETTKTTETGKERLSQSRVARRPLWAVAGVVLLVLQQHSFHSFPTAIHLLFIGSR